MGQCIKQPITMPMRPGKASDKKGSLTRILCKPHEGNSVLMVYAE